MSVAEHPSDEVVKFREPAELEGGIVESTLKRRLGRGVYVQEVSEQPGGDLLVVLGNATPRDLSDCRAEENTIKFVTIRDVHTIRAVATNGGYYQLQLPDRNEILEGIADREQDILDRLDYALARSIYSNVHDLPSVRSQLNPILQILHWVREEDELTVGRIEHAQNSPRSREYLQFLESLDYVRLEGQRVTAGEVLQYADLHQYDHEEFGRQFLGDVVERGYYIMRDQFGLSMLSHYQKYSGAYYYDAVQRGTPTYAKDVDGIVQTLATVFDERADELYVKSKLRELDRVGVLEYTNGYVTGVDGVYERVASETPVA